MTKEAEQEDNTRTSAKPVNPVHASRDDEPNTDAPTGDEVEIQETLELDQPEKSETDIQDHIQESDDPRGEIYKRFSKKREQEIEESAVYTADPEQQVLDGNEEIPESEIETPESTDIIKPITETSTTQSDVENLVEVKILGDIKQVPRKKVDDAGGVENYQIRVAAQEQMKRNAQERKALEERQAALDEQERRISAQQAAVPVLDQQPSQSPDRSTPPDDQNLVTMAQQYQDAVLDGDENAPSILLNMVKTAAQTGEKFDQNAFRKQVKEEVLADQRHARVVRATTNLIEQHPELDEKDHRFDPRMYTAIDDETSVVQRQHPEWEPDQVVQEAYDRIHQWKGGHKTETMTDKQKEKQAIARPKVGSQRYQKPPPPPRETNSDYVKKIKQQRGQEVT